MNLFNKYTSCILKFCLVTKNCAKDSCSKKKKKLSKDIYSLRWILSFNKDNLTNIMPQFIWASYNTCLRDHEHVNSASDHWIR